MSIVMLMTMLLHVAQKMMVMNFDCVAFCVCSFFMIVFYVYMFVCMYDVLRVWVKCICMHSHVVARMYFLSRAPRMDLRMFSIVKRHA